MTTIAIFIVLIAAIFILNIFAIWYIIRLIKGTGAKAAEKGFDFLQKEIQNLRTSFDSKIGESARDIHNSVRTQTSESQRLFSDITKHLLNVERSVTETKESSKQLFSLGEQLQNFEKILKNQKQRGSLGEASLELILSNMLPPDAYKLQYQIGAGRVGRRDSQS